MTAYDSGKEIYSSRITEHRGERRVCVDRLFEHHVDPSRPEVVTSYSVLAQSFCVEDMSLLPTDEDAVRSVMAIHRGERSVL